MVDLGGIGKGGEYDQNIMYEICKELIITYIKSILKGRVHFDLKIRKIQSIYYGRKEIAEEATVRQP